MESQIEEGTLRDTKESQGEQIRFNQDAHPQCTDNPRILILEQNNTGGETYLQLESQRIREANGTRAEEVVQSGLHSSKSFDIGSL